MSALAVINLLQRMSWERIPHTQRRQVMDSIGSLMRNGAIDWRPIKEEPEHRRVTIEVEYETGWKPVEIHYSPITQEVL